MKFLVQLNITLLISFTSTNLLAIESLSLNTNTLSVEVEKANGILGKYSPKFAPSKISVFDNDLPVIDSKVMVSFEEAKIIGSFLSLQIESAISLGLTEVELNRNLVQRINECPEGRKLGGLVSFDCNNEDDFFDVLHLPISKNLGRFYMSGKAFLSQNQEASFTSSSEYLIIYIDGFERFRIEMESDQIAKSAALYHSEHLSKIDRESAVLVLSFQHYKKLIEGDIYVELFSELPRIMLDEKHKNY
ncbi:MAG: hypothetical protein AB8E15_04170 [Bdellovibrionales bacterium]